MSDLAQKIKEHVDHQEACGWHHDWPEALAAIRAVLNLCETEPSSLIDTDDLLEFVASALGVREDPEG